MAGKRNMTGYYKTDGYVPADGTYYCDYEGCGYNTTNRSNLSHHLFHHRKNGHTKLTGAKTIASGSSKYEEIGDGRFRCNICGKEFDRKRQCSAHLGFHFIKKANYKCSICGRVFSRPNTLSSHLKMHRRRGDIPAQGEPAKQAKAQAKARAKAQDTPLPMVIELDGGGGDSVIELPITIKVRISVVMEKV